MPLDSSSIPTPSLVHLTQEDYEHIYDPAEDSFILLDALEQDAKELKGLEPGCICVEIGSGSGIASAFLGGIIGPSNALYLATDINPRATSCTFRTGSQNKIPVQPILTSLTSSLLPRLSSSIDVLLFNPPYVPTSLAELDDTQNAPGIGSTWAGGDEGMNVTAHVLAGLDDLLSSRGVFYLVAIKQNKPLEIIERIQERTEGRVVGKVALQRRAGGEHLFVLKFSRPARDP